MEKAKRMIIAVIAACLLLTGCGNKYKDAYERGLKFLTDGDYEQAITAFTEAIEIDPKQYKAYSGRASAYLATGKREEAVTDLCSAVENGMKAEEIQEGIIGEVVSKIIEEYKGSAEEAAEYIKGAGFFDDTIIRVIPEELNEILADIITEFSENGKSIEDLIEYLKNLGFIDGDKVSDLIKDLPAATVVNEILDYENRGKTIEDLNNAGYGKGSKVLYVGKSFGITDMESGLKTVIGSVPDHRITKRSNGADYQISYRYDEKLNESRSIYVFEHVSDSIRFLFVAGCSYGDGSRADIAITNLAGNEDKLTIAYVIDNNTSLEFNVVTASGAIVSLGVHYVQNEVDLGENPEMWAKHKTTFISRYADSVSFCNDVLKTYGLTVADLYDHAAVLQYLEEYGSK